MNQMLIRKLEETPWIGLLDGHNNTTALPLQAYVVDIIVPGQQDECDLTTHADTLHCAITWYDQAQSSAYLFALNPYVDTKLALFKTAHPDSDDTRPLKPGLHRVIAAVEGNDLSEWFKGSDSFRTVLADSHPGVEILASPLFADDRHIVPGNPSLVDGVPVAAHMFFPAPGGEPKPTAPFTDDCSALQTYVGDVYAAVAASGVQVVTLH